MARLATLLSMLAKSGTVGSDVTVYDSKHAPKISILDYLNRWLEFTQCSENVLCIASVYMDRLMSEKNYSLSSQNIHRVLLTALVLASKWQDDNVFSTSDYALVGGVSIVELKRLERSFLIDIDWDLHVTANQYANYEFEFSK